MYEQFYGLSEKPFSMTPDPAFLYLGERHSVALTMLQYGLMNRAGITVLSGEIGAGKTTLVRRLLDEIDDEVVVGLISNTHEAFGNLMQWICVAFDLPITTDSKAELYDQFSDYLIDCYAQGKRTVVIVDEAQNLSIQTLEELRLLTNINSDKDQLVQLIVTGQPELREKLRQPGLEQFIQRIGVDFHLKSMDENDADGYIRHRLITAGGDSDLIEPPARGLIFSMCDGVPRRMNAMCDTALVYGFAEGAQSIGIDLVHAMVLERAEAGLFGAGLIFSDSDELKQRLETCYASSVAGMTAQCDLKT